MTIDEIPFPGMPDLPTLWAVHVQGPDDVIAAAGKAEAERHAQGINDWYERRSKEPDFDPVTFPRIRAEVIEYPYSRESHAREVARGDERWAA
jgi:hypothetical protein